MITDPFVLKSLPKWHPHRLMWTAYARSKERVAALQFSSLELPKKQIKILPNCSTNKDSTAVTGLQLSYLLAALQATESLLSTAVVEIGSYRGATTKALALATKRRVYAVDPFIGYGGAEDDFQIFLNQTSDLPNLEHLRYTSGEASRKWSYGAIGFLFIDALHDYVNTRFDIEVWGAKLAVGGLMALHDTDNRNFSGTRKAAKEAAMKMSLWAHIDDLVILRKI